MKTKTSFRDLYSFSGFRARARFKCGVKGDPVARVVELVRHQKKTSAPVAGDHPTTSGTAVFTGSGTWMPGRPASTWTLNIGASPARRAV